MTTRELAYEIVHQTLKLLGVRVTPGQFWKLKFAVMDVLEGK